MGDGNEGKVGGEDEKRSRENTLPANSNDVARVGNERRGHEAARGHSERQKEVEDRRRNVALTHALQLAQRGKAAIEKSRSRGEDETQGARAHECRR